MRLQVLLYKCMRLVLDTHLVDEVRVPNGGTAVVQEGARAVRTQPALALIDLLLAECHLYALVILWPCRGSGE